MLNKLFKLSTFKIAIILALVFAFLALVTDQMQERFPFIYNLAIKVNLDSKFRTKKVKHSPENVVIVTVDEKSIERFGRWPWNRRILARGLEKIRLASPKAISMDMVFSEIDHTSQTYILKKLEKKYHQKHANDRFYKLLTEISNRTDSDKILSETIKKINNDVPITLGYFFYFNKSDIENLSKDWEKQFRHIFHSKISAKISDTETPPENMPTGLGALSSHQIYANSIKNHGFIDISTDWDGIIRKTHLIGKFKNTLFPSLALKTASLALGKEIVVQFDNYGIENIFLGDDIIPADSSGQIWINYSGPAFTFPYYSFSDVYDGKLAPDAFKNKVVMVGVSAKAVGDMRATPLDRSHPGIEINASIVDNLINKNYLRRPDVAIILEILFILLMGFLYGHLYRKLSPLVSSLATIGLIIIYFSGDRLLFFNNGVLANSFIPITQIFFTFIITNIFKYFVEEREGRKIKGAFRRYVAPAVVNEILKHPSDLKLGGEKRRLTVLFSDIRGFTSISENIEPEKLTKLLNLYLTEMTDIVFRHQGMLDKYVGDELMAVYGAPLKTATHVSDACISAMKMMKKLEFVRENWAQAGIKDLNIGIGIHTGDMIVGNMGSERIFDYTVIGDSVNLGSRLQGTNKVYGTNIIISGEVRNQLSNDFYARELDFIRVRGKSKPVKIFQLFTDQPDPQTQDVCAQYLEGLALYRNRKWVAAANVFEKIKAKDAPSRILNERCQQYMKHEPPANWNGIFVMTSK